MAELKPCTQCNRHVAITEVECPFCHARLELAASPASRLGRVSRAAVFAGAALATAACGGKKTPTTQQQGSGSQAGSQTAPPADAAVEQPDKNNIPMPYGAPPARRRVV